MEENQKKGKQKIKKSRKVKNMEITKILPGDRREEKKEEQKREKMMRL